MVLEVDDVYLWVTVRPLPSQSRKFLPKWDEVDKLKRLIAGDRFSLYEETEAF